MAKALLHIRFPKRRWPRGWAGCKGACHCCTSSRRQGQTPAAQRDCPPPMRWAPVGRTVPAVRLLVQPSSENLLLKVYRKKGSYKAEHGIDGEERRAGCCKTCLCCTSQSLQPFEFLSGAAGDRTPDLMTASHALSHLSYSPKPLLRGHQEYRSHRRLSRVAQAALRLPTLILR